MTALSAGLQPAAALPLLAALLAFAGWLTVRLWRRGPPTVRSRLAIALGATALFAVLATMPPMIVGWDLQLAEGLHAQASPGLLDAAFAITQFGNFRTLLALAIAVALLLALRRQWSDLGLWLVVTAGTGLLNRALKLGFERVRPLHDHGLVIEPAYSFPSGHASGALAVYGLLMVLLLPRLAAAARLPLLLATVALVLLIGASRVILQVHFLSDVVAGHALAAAVLASAHALREQLQARYGRTPG
ncbi:MAG: phosphatase PAP2 family protein [Gammaproteobacteria bacterium]|nr:phosphatase PAP2 family protein [Gammaproteobacteria bacterium]